MKKYLMLAGSLFVFGCTSIEEKPVKLEYADLAVSYNEMESAKWQQLERFPARYPKKQSPKQKKVAQLLSMSLRHKMRLEIFR
ncbi:hypothetical protein P4S56_02525 [Pseudoalteromonas sp. Hal056]|uniref:hypothetical protein n=1 Tax=Pseudoalteromonas sp. Hal056 TaxID=3035159 RepID=UPI00301D75AC